MPLSIDVTTGNLCLTPNGLLCICPDVCEYCQSPRPATLNVTLSGLTQKFGGPDAPITEALANATHVLDYPDESCLTLLTILNTITNPNPALQSDYIIIISINFLVSPPALNPTTLVTLFSESIINGNTQFRGNLFWNYIPAPSEINGSGQVNCSGVNWRHNAGTNPPPFFQGGFFQNLNFAPAFLTT